jgi:hypothetical protein
MRHVGRNPRRRDTRPAERERLAPRSASEHPLSRLEPFTGVEFAPAKRLLLVTRGMALVVHRHSVVLPEDNVVRCAHRRERSACPDLESSAADE